MAIPLYGVEAHTGQIITLDDEAVVRDQASAAGVGGSTYTPYIVSTLFDNGGAGGSAKLRRMVQHVHAEGGVTVDVTPYRDEQETGNTIQRVLATGDNPVVTAPMNESGTTFQFKVELSGFDAAVELGKASFYVLPRRQER